MQYVHWFTYCVINIQYFNMYYENTYKIKKRVCTFPIMEICTFKCITVSYVGRCRELSTTGACVIIHTSKLVQITTLFIPCIKHDMGIIQLFNGYNLIIFIQWYQCCNYSLHRYMNLYRSLVTKVLISTSCM